MLEIILFRDIPNCRRRGRTIITSETSKPTRTSCSSTSKEQKNLRLTLAARNVFIHSYYAVLYIIFTIGLPILIPHYVWNESISVAFWVNLFRYAINYSHLDVVNCVAHTLCRTIGDRPYDHRISAREHSFTNAWTLGEGGHHNYHHAFPSDYKDSEYGGGNYLSLVPIIIRFFERRGWIWDLKTTSPEAIASRAKRTGDGTFRWEEEKSFM